jgi:glucose uptake protein GlcU
MRKAWLILSFVLIAISVVGIAAAAYVRHDNAVRVERAEALVRNLQQLTIGKSGYQIAEAIAKKYGNTG